MKITEALATAHDAITVKRVFAEPYEKDGLTVIAAAAVAGGAGAAPAPTHKGSRARAVASLPARARLGHT